MINRMARPLLALPRSLKRVLALSIDTLMCVLCVWLALSLRFEAWTAIRGAQWLAVAGAVVIALPIFIVSGLYRAIFRYAGATALLALVRACLAFGAIYLFLFGVLGVTTVPRTLGVLVPLLLFLMVGGSRLVARYWLGGLYVSALKRKKLPQVMIYGAGAAGRQLAAALINGQDMVVRGYIDDAVHLQGSSVNGLQIVSMDKFKAQATERKITDVLLAVPSASHRRRAEILSELLTLHLHVRTVPGMADLAQGRVKMTDLHEVAIEDLLGRDPVPPIENLMHRHIRGQVVIVTGAGGSIGTELCRQIVQQSPSALLLVEISEYALYAIHQELIELAPDVRVIPLLASVRDADRLREIMRTWRPDTIYHAAAYKHVPMVEHNPAEGVKNNAVGTLTTAQVAIECQVRQFVLVSTDKAVRPTNIMGASKRVAELVLQALAAQRSATRFSMVRFGNVLGSSGSVVPLFRKQIEAGGPITLTHPDITRYFMTIPEAAQLVIQAGAMSQGGDVFVLDMGEPVRIIDLARRLVELSGRTVREASMPNGDIELQITGLRPGEKLYEELLIGDDVIKTSHPRVMKAHEPFLPWGELSARFDQLNEALTLNDVPAIKHVLQHMLPGYAAHAEVVDWIYLERLRTPASASPPYQQVQNLTAAQSVEMGHL